ncbi:unnamed protein product [Brachionus calyciflorus]|uniref:Neurobeachin n=1 Tax=Brachionus calyciflorus TaxID=104777 RepID=A0A813M5D8_9BILA|nr:unnamed protein product [Brachionus calyciflorus]
MEEPSENLNENNIQLSNESSIEGPEVQPQSENNDDNTSTVEVKTESHEISKELTQNEISLENNEAEKQNIEPQLSTEFTYFSLGSKPDENEDQINEEEKNEETKLEQINLQEEGEKIQIEETKEDLEPKNEEPLVEEKIPLEENNVVVESTPETNGFNLDNLTNLQIDVMIDKIRQNSISNKDVCNYVLNLLVDGEFDLEKNFVIKNYKTILLMMQVIKCANPSLKAELWSLFTAILRKSQLNLQACVEIGLIETALHELEDADQVCADLIVEMLTVLANYNINVEELKAIFNRLKGDDQVWKKNSVKILNVLKAMPHRYGPDEFFSLPGKKSSGISLPPIRNWPYQNGFTFSTWFRIDPVSGANIEKEKPYLYWFGTNKGIGYTAFFMGSCLVLSYKTKPNGKEMQHCIQYEFKPREWYMITISHVYNRWSKSQILCYINGYHFSTAQIPFYIDQNEIFDRCFIGCTPDANEMNLFSGQLSSIYLFNHALESPVVDAIYNLGPSYKNQFRFENETGHLHLKPETRRLLYDGKLTQSVVFLYNPVNCDSQLLLQSAPKQNQSLYFSHNAHALMLSDVKAVKTASIYSVLLSIGGIQVLYVLFGQLDYRQLDDTIDYTVCNSLIEILCDMIEISYNVQIQMINSKGLLAISYYLEKASRDHITLNVLNSILKLTKYLVQLPNPNGTVLLKQLLDHILFNPAIWVYCSVEVQTKLYSYLATEFVNDLNIYINIRRISAVIQTIHAIKYYYWVVDPRDRSGYEPKSIESLRPNRNIISQLRAYMLLYIKELVTKENGVQQDELQALLNYLHTVNENENITDVLKLLVTLMNEHPPSMIPAFDAKLGIRTVMKLLASENETIRLQTLKLLGFFLQKSTFKRKAENMNTYNLFALISDRLSMYSHDFTMSLYNTLYEILVERTTNQVIDQTHQMPDPTHHIENPLIIKVITSLIRNAPAKSKQVNIIKKQFLNDLIALCNNGKENRRIILQMSVWQELLIGLAHVYPSDPDEFEITNLVFKTFKILLHHAIKYEYGGWRVWIDTLSILHSRVSKEDYQLKMNKLYEEYERNKGLNQDQKSSENDSETQEKTFQLPPFRIPEFKWSHMHKLLLNDMLLSIENEIELWKGPDCQVKSVLDAVNHVDNAVFCVNTIHTISQLADILTNACGGLLPLLASATTANTNEIEIMENTEGMTNQEGIQFLERIMRINDIVILGCSNSFSELEQEKNLPNGAIVRQSLRLTFTSAVKTCLEFRRKNLNQNTNTQLSSLQNEVRVLSNKDPVEALIELHINNTKNPTNQTSLIGAKIYPDCLLQNIDIFRLRALVYRDTVRNDKNKLKPFVIVDDPKQSQYVALSAVYFISVLMVSRYRDIIEANSSNGSSQQSLNDSTSSLNNRKVHNFSDSTSIGTNDDSRQSDHFSNKRSNGNNNDDSSLYENGVSDSLSNQQINEFSEIALSDQQQPQGINTISSNQINNSNVESKPESATSSNLPQMPKSSQNAESILKAANVSITDKLEKALSSVAPILRDIFVEFSQLLSKVIVGSHGQELITSGISALRHSSSVIELVMLLCSQEWQTSLQKHAGLSFIELVNEGRLLGHASKDHIVRVANEADFILNRMRADDVKKHSEFEQLCAQTTLERKEEETICEHLITAARKRDHYFAIKLRDKILNLITDKQGCWYNPHKSFQTFWKLDNWEDDMRRRRRFVKNPNGTSHSEAVLKSSIDNVQDAINNKDELIKQLNKPINDLNSNNYMPNEQLHISDAELEQEVTGPIHYATKCKLVCNVAAVNGTLSITSNELYFEVDEIDSVFKSLDPSLMAYADNLHGKWHFNEIRAIFSRRYLLQNVALEIFVANRSSVMFAFTDRRTVEKVVNILPKVGVGPRYGLPQNRHTSLASPQQLFRSANMTQKWQRREISNFEYLMYLNTIAGRTYNDLNQYLIFPWILINYDSPTIDLNSPTSYRDLSKPIGALNPSRKQFFTERYQNWDANNIPPFHYGTHYSTAAFTLNWLIRVEPFSSIFLNLQDGKFDHADRTFHSIQTSWKNCQRDTSDVKELIPEFFYLPEMFLNLNNFNMGETQDKKKVSDVELPAWAKDAYDFVRINRMALESEFVSCQLHQWIDLIFGYKQRGPEAVRNCNVFYHLTYEGAVNLESIEDPITRQAIESQIKNFGQTPCQLLTEPHPPRSSPLSISPMMFTQHNEDVCMIMKFLSNAPIIFVSANTTLPSYITPVMHSTHFQQVIVTISSKHEFSLNKYNPSAAQMTQSSAINNYTAYNEASTTTSYPQVDKTNSNASINSQNLNNSINANQTTPQLQQQLPVLMDQLLAFNTGLHRRQLGENFDDKLQLTHNNFIVTYDNRFIIATGFFDKSFRVFNTDTAKITQIIFGHYDLVTCVNRSEMTQNGNCFVATGSRDSTIMIWIWNGLKGLIVNKDLSQAETNENPSPGAILTGHIRQIVGVVISSELGLVISASQNGPILVHTVYGELLRQFENDSDVLDDPTQLYMLPDAENVCAIYKNNHVAFFTINGNKLVDTQIQDDIIYSLTMSQDGQYLVLGGEKGLVYIYRSHDLSVAYTFPQCDASIKSLVITQDQKYIIAGLSTGCLIVFNVNFNLITYRRKAATNN